MMLSVIFVCQVDSFASFFTRVSRCFRVQRRRERVSVNFSVIFVEAEGSGSFLFQE